MLLALIFSAMQAFAMETVTVPGLTSKTMVLVSSNIPGFCASRIKPELRTVNGRPALIVDEVRYRFTWQQISTAQETQEIEQTADSSTLKHLTQTERTVVKIKGNAIELTISSGTKDKNGIFHIQDPQPIRCVWAARK